MNKKHNPGVRCSTWLGARADRLPNSAALYSSGLAWWLACMMKTTAVYWDILGRPLRQSMALAYALHPLTATADAVNYLKRTAALGANRMPGCGFRADGARPVTVTHVVAHLCGCGALGNGKRLARLVKRSLRGFAMCLVGDQSNDGLNGVHGGFSEGQCVDKGCGVHSAPNAEVSRPAPKTETL